MGSAPLTSIISASDRAAEHGQFVRGGPRAELPGLGLGVRGVEGLPRSISGCVECVTPLRAASTRMADRVAPVFNEVKPNEPLGYFLVSYGR